jgi:hypothetical protein
MDTVQQPSLPNNYPFAFYSGYIKVTQVDGGDTEPPSSSTSTTSSTSSSSSASTTSKAEGDTMYIPYGGVVYRDAFWATFEPTTTESSAAHTVDISSAPDLKLFAFQPYTTAHIFLLKKKDTGKDYHVVGEIAQLENPTYFDHNTPLAKEKEKEKKKAKEAEEAEEGNKTHFEHKGSMHYIYWTGKYNKCSQNCDWNGKDVPTVEKQRKKLDELSGTFLLAAVVYDGDQTIAIQAFDKPAITLVKSRG